MDSVILATLLFCYINVPVVDMREHPESKAEIVSQAFFSEQVNLIEEHEDWVKIETIVDRYRGWVKKNVVHQRVDPFSQNPQDLAVKVNRLAAHLYAVQDTIYGPMLTLPFESRLAVLEPTDIHSNSRWIKVQLPDAQQAYIQRGDVEFQSPVLDRSQISEWSFRFLGLPYTWGGRSSFGYDCSGFVQMLYRQMGYSLPRDSKDQAQWEGFTAISLSELRPGDLLFFGQSSDKIRHVGMFIGEDRFIHSTVAENAPYIHISRLSDPEWNGSGKWTFCTARTLRDK
jgi:hypothetical protein